MYESLSIYHRVPSGIDACISGSHLCGPAKARYCARCRVICHSVCSSCIPPNYCFCLLSGLRIGILRKTHNSLRGPQNIGSLRPRGMLPSSLKPALAKKRSMHAWKRFRSDSCAARAVSSVHEAEMKTEKLTPQALALDFDDMDAVLVRAV